MNRLAGWLVWSVVIACCGLPLAWMVAQIAGNPAAWAEMHLGGGRLSLLGRTLLYNAGAAAVAVGLALPVGIVLGRGRGKLTAALWFVTPLSLLLPSIVFAYGWSQFFRLLNIQFAQAEWADILRCVWSLGTWLWPLPAVVIGLALRRMDTQVQQQALLDGVLWRITLRQLLGPIVAAFCMVAILAMQEYSIWEPTGISVVATEIRMVFETGTIGSPANPIATPDLGAMGVRSMEQGARSAAALAAGLPLMAIIAALAAVAAWAVRRMSAVEHIDSGPWPRALNAGWAAIFPCILIVAVTHLCPAGSLMLSLHRTPEPGRLWEVFAPSVGGSMAVAAVTGLVAFVIALGASTTRSRPVIVVALLAFLAGGQMLAIAMIRLYNRTELSWVYNQPPIIVIAYLGRFLWVALLAAQMSWTKPWRQLRDLAAVDGATESQTAMRVIWPMALPVLGAAALLVTILSLCEVPATALLNPANPPMLVPDLLQWVHMLRYDPMIEASLLLMGMVLLLSLGALLLVWAGGRLSRWWAVPTAVLLMVLMGCDRPSSPDAVWCDTGIGPGQVIYPRAIAYAAKDDTYFIVDRHAHVQHLDRDGRCLHEWRMPEYKTGKPVGLSVGPDGNLYVPDTHYSRIMVFSPDGRLLRQWGRNGTGPGEFIFPTDVVFDSSGRIFVSEYGDNDRIQVFDQTGKWLFQFGRFGSGDGEFSRPQSMVIAGNLVYVTDACNHRIVVFTTDGRFVRTMGSVGSGPGQFRFPYGMDMDSRGRLVVCEFGNNRVQLIDKQTGGGINTWGSAGREAGQLAYPWAVAVDKRNRIVAVDSGNNRLQVFRF